MNGDSNQSAPRHYLAGRAVPSAPAVPARSKGLNKKTMQFVDRMDQLGCSPEEFLARVILGQEPPAQNPFLELLKLWLERNRGKVLSDTQIDQIMQRANKYLTQEPATIETRVNAARDLMQYKYPKRKAVEHSGNVGVGTGVMQTPGTMGESEWEKKAERVALSVIEGSVVEDADGST